MDGSREAARHAVLANQFIQSLKVSFRPHIASRHYLSLTTARLGGLAVR